MTTLEDNTKIRRTLILSQKALNQANLLKDVYGISLSALVRILVGEKYETKIGK